MRGLSRFAERFIEPSPGVSPMTVGRSSRDVQRGGGFQRQTAEETQRNQVGAGLIFPSQTTQGRLQREQVIVRGVVDDVQAVERDPCETPAALEAMLVAGAIDQN